MEFPFSSFESTVHKFWEDQQVYATSNDSNLPKCYVLDMFPYPSGSGLHVGHPLGYIASDIYSRYKRLCGYNVLHPMGFDAFGLPAEQYAIESGRHPSDTTRDNIRRYKEQLSLIGFSYDWNREVITSDPNYYRWTQWIFSRLFDSWYDLSLNKARPIDALIAQFKDFGNSKVEAATTIQNTFSAEDWKRMSDAERGGVLMHYRLAYQAKAEVNWCEALGTVLANDEVVNGLSVRGGHPVTKLPMLQWFLRITAYAQRLLDGLDRVDFPESLKEMQRNWIGRSEGAVIRFEIQGQEVPLTIFTTRPDTLFGVTFMVLAPEHPLVATITKPTHKAEVEQYQQYVKSRSERERQAEVKTVSGAFTGACAVHPFTGEPLPIWISEYVLMGYGTGAIMAVPADDDRDALFAQHFSLPIREIIERSNHAERGDKTGTLINSQWLNGLSVLQAIERALVELEQKNIGHRKVNFRMRDAGFSRQRYWGEPFPIVYDHGVATLVPESDLPVLLPPMESFHPTGKPESPLSRLHTWVNLPHGLRRETDTMPGYAGSSWYYLRYMDPHNMEAPVGEKAEKYWQQVDVYCGGAEHAVGHLLYSRFWHKFLHDLGHVSTEEPYRKVINQGMIQGRSNLIYRVKGEKKWVSKGLTNLYEVHAIHVDVHLTQNDVLDLPAFFKRFPEYQSHEWILENDEYICGWEIEKMSKSKYNVVNPDDIIAQYGADTFRMYEMFLGPIEDHKPWNTQGIEGVSKFIRKVWRWMVNESGSLSWNQEAPSAAELKILHRTIRKITDDIERFSFNTSVSAFMIAWNELIDLNCRKQAILEPMLILMAPFAPFITEHIWQLAGHAQSIHLSQWPLFDEQWIIEKDYHYPISINGKVRQKINLPLDLSEVEVKERILSDPNILKWIEDKPIRQFIYVKGRIINVVV